MPYHTKADHWKHQAELIAKENAEDRHQKALKAAREAIIEEKAALLQLSDSEKAVLHRMLAETDKTTPSNGHKEGTY